MKRLKKFIVKRIKIYNPDIGEYTQDEIIGEYTTYAVSEKQALNNVIFRERLKPIDCHYWSDHLLVDEAL